MTRVIAPALARRLHAQARADRWYITVEQFTPVLAAVAERAFPGKPPEIAELEHRLETLHLEDLALACACSAGKEAAWDHFVREYRPILYRAADALQPGGGAREIADALYAELYGVAERLGERRSLLRYFHGRSSLATWLRSVLSQRFIDRVRVQRREDELPAEDSPATLAAPEQTVDPRRERNMRMMRKELSIAIAALDTRDRLRLKCYYAQDMTLAAIGKVLKEHEATVSRHLTRTRRAIREALEEVLRRDYGMDEAAMLECFASIVNDPGALDIADLVGTGPGSKPQQE